MLITLKYSNMENQLSYDKARIEALEREVERLSLLKNINTTEAKEEKDDSKVIILKLRLLTSDVLQAYNEATGESLVDFDNEIYNLLEILPSVIRSEKSSHAIGFVKELSSVMSRGGITDYYNESKIKETL
tara:strand:+ start:495 stop:887 length:393 start_codon:yes stop_codon:yes gene_type:complete